MTSQPNKTQVKEIPSIDPDSSLKYEAVIPVVEESRLDKSNVKIFRGGLIYAAIIAAVVAFFLFNYFVRIP